MRYFLFPLFLIAPAAVLAAPPPVAVIADPPADRAHPAAMAAFVIPAQEGALNAVMYRAAGVGPHPTLLLFHGFPGNEQNLDLAQAARRAGWNVLTFHYRGSWGSPGRFSFANCLQDGATALAYLRRPEVVARFGIDPSRIAVAGHSMGGIVAARVGADDPRVIGAFLIDPADFAAIGRSFADPAKRQAFLLDEVRGDMPPLAGTSEDAIMAETAHAGRPLDLVAAMPALAGRPLALLGTTRGIGFMAEAAARAARKAGARHLDAETFETDHSFSDARIALAGRLVMWLEQFQH
ncbi:alpha/beta hydrolase family protein [Gluconacetobacter takamatsuzukensis]|uniref:Alpha/beta fold hydrolase n=1 Tax=Gluconacetobacter takamatsuzukensis TaxID=1286190 RepID=A0A7W4KDL2_9PROT|nr:alpha/beta fold hydrolase [Gluconacetobacter takamatsuzukensis]MBB2205008.1 alpha/beta fold hydrolase [Gluconacetobacter takamatsuzukensis]